MQLQREYKRVVVKIGSSLLFGRLLDDASEDFIFPLRQIASQIADLIKEGKEMVIVSSGAIASGMRLLKMKSRPKELVSLQAVAAVGQHFLIHQYQRCFQKERLNCAQVLLTWEDFDDRRRYLNARNTLLKLLDLGVVPIVNENDTVSTEEIKFGDNDRLSALVATLIKADLLIILSDVDGLLDKENKVIPLVDQIIPKIKLLACSTNKATCVGGMISKIEAAGITMDSGIPAVIANGHQDRIISSIIAAPDKHGTLFIPKKALSAKKHWIAFGTKPKGKVIVDDGAKRALINKKSLLSVGVVGMQGNFASGDIISIVDKEANEFARGKIRLESMQLDKILGRRSDKEVIHCDNIVIL